MTTPDFLDDDENSTILVVVRNVERQRRRMPERGSVPIGRSVEAAATASGDGENLCTAARNGNNMLAASAAGL
jgi:hypothetical protein